MKLKGLLIACLLAIGFLAGCTGGMRVSTDEIIANVLTTDEEVQAFYTEGEIIIYENEEIVEKTLIKEYHSEDGKMKTISIDQSGGEIISLNDGESAIVFDKNENKAFKMEVASYEIPKRSQKEQIILLIEAMKNTHNYEYGGEEKINDFLTHHIKLTPKEQNSIFGKLDIWVDQKTWFPIKSINIVGESRIEIIYTEVDTSPKFSDDTFTLTLPDDVEIVNLEDQLDEQVGTIEEAEEKLGRPFLILNEENLQIDIIEIYEFKEFNRPEISIFYTNNEGQPVAYLSVFPTPEGQEIDISESDFKIRGQIAEYMSEINSYMWDEDGLRYNILLVGLEPLSTEEVLEMAERMVESSNR